MEIRFGFIQGMTIIMQIRPQDPFSGMNSMKCHICGNTNGNSQYTVEERKIGLGDKFTYFQCKDCECLQILNVSEDMSRYYPLDFNSFVIEPDVMYNNIFLRPFLKMRDYYAVFDKGIVGKFLYSLYPNYNLKALKNREIKPFFI
jgi:hypothetical protein